MLFRKAPWLLVQTIYTRGNSTCHAMPTLVDFVLNVVAVFVSVVQILLYIAAMHPHSRFLLRLK